MGGGYGSASGHGVPGGSYSQRYNQYTDSRGSQYRELHEEKGKGGKGGILVLAAGAGGLAVSVLLVAGRSAMLSTGMSQSCLIATQDPPVSLTYSYCSKHFITS